MTAMRSIQDVLREQEEAERQEAEVTKEIQLLQQDDDDGFGEVSSLTLDTVVEDMAVQPPGVPFFTSSPGCLYAEDSLLWPPQHQQQQSPLARCTATHIKQLTKEGCLMRKFKCGAVMGYLLHLLTTTTDPELEQAAHSTLCYALSMPLPHLLSHLYMILTNLGADITRVDQNIDELKLAVAAVTTSASTLEPNSNMTDTHCIHKIKLILEQLQRVLASGQRAMCEVLDAIMLLLTALGLDPKLFDSGLDYLISQCMVHCLALYPNTQRAVQGVVERLVSYCENDAYNVSYLCGHFLPSGRSKVVRSSLAFLQVQHILGLNQVVVQAVEVEAVAGVVEQQQQVLTNGQLNYQHLHLLVKLLDFCVDLTKLTTPQKKHLFSLCNLLEPVIKKTRNDVNNLNSVIFRNFGSLIIAKWKKKLFQESLDTIVKQFV